MKKPENRKDIIFPDSESTHPLDIDYIRTNIPCQWACPALTNIPGYIEAIYHGDYDGAYKINRNANLFPGVLGRICSRPCEDACRHGETDLGDPVSICHLKRVAADEKSDDHLISEEMFAQTGKTVGVVGAGPSGLAVAHSLAIFGHRVVIYESLPGAGGMLQYGIPAFRLPREIISREIFNITRLGITITGNVKIGRDLSVQDLMDRHDAVVMAAGCYRSRKLAVPGEHLKGVYSGLEFMMRANRGDAPTVGNTVIVIGGGFTAMDCARSARRLGASKISICILDTEEDLIVTREEILETKREGIEFVSLVSTRQILGVDDVTGIEFARNRFGRSRGSEGREIFPIEGSEFEMPADTIISAIGQTPRRMALDYDGKTEITFNPETGDSSVAGLFGAGDFVRGASTVIEAVGNGRQTAVEVDRYLIGRERRRKQVVITETSDTHRKRAWDFTPKHHIPTLPLKKRYESMDTEVETGFPTSMGQNESQRCYLCNFKYEIHIPECIYCRLCIDVCPRDCIEMVTAHNLNDGTHPDQMITSTKWREVAGIVIDNDRCIRCGECLRVCPTQCIHVGRISLVEKYINRETEQS